MTRNYVAHHNQELQVNADSVRTEELHGREHVVAEATLVREMVLKGEMLPFEEIARTALAWNGAPVTVTHPRGDDGGFLPASADAANFEGHATGHVFNVEPNAETRSLDAEVWLDAEKAEEAAAALDRDDPAGMLLDGDSVEVSTGYWYTKEPSTGTYEGVDYSATQHDVQPDHLATLPNGVGECSIEDGCGAGVTDDAAAAAANSPDVTTVAYAANCGDCSGDGDDAIDASTLRKRFAEVLGLNGGDDFAYGGPSSTLNADVGDAVRWQSDAAGSVETSDGTYRYGVVVDGLQDGPDEKLKVAVYEPGDDGWETRDEDNDLDEERLEVVGPDGKGSLPAISQLGGASADGSGDGADDGTVAGTEGFRLVLAATNDDGTSTMTTYDIDDIAEHSALSRETLEALDDDELAAHAEQVLADDGGDDDGTGDDNPDDGSGDGDGDSDDDADTANSGDALTAEDVREIVNDAVEEVKNGGEKDKLIRTIRNHSSQDIPESELAGMSKEALEGLAQDVKPTGGVYAGRAGAAGNSGGDEPSMGASIDALGDGGGD